MELASLRASALPKEEAPAETVLLGMCVFNETDNNFTNFSIDKKPTSIIIVEPKNPTLRHNKNVNEKCVCFRCYNKE